MKWLSVFIVAFAAIFTTFAQAADKVEIQSISHAALPEAKESITFKLSGPAVPKIFTMNGDNPRLVIDFPGSSYKGKSVIPIPEGKLATAIRTGLHQTPAQKVRVVVDLAKDAAIRHTLGEYVEADRTLTVTLAAGLAAQQQKSREEPKDAAADDRKPAAKPLPSPEELAAKPLDEKPIPPVLHRKEAKEEPPVQEKGGVQSPQLIDITFDDSSNKGEMVLFHLNDFYPPTVSAVEKDTPRVFCDFMEMGLGEKVQDNIAAKGKYVQRIRTTKHKKPDKVQVILELSPDRDYDLQQVFFKNDNLFVLIINELAPEKKADNEQKTEKNEKTE
ncbi:MAG TPA: hypothetical protein DDY32_12995 [Desulfobulbaceae bacterium]|nr:hypothetical protein [Desulfobulbaceae bacterium]